MQLAELRQEFLLKLDSRLPFRPASFLEATVASKCVPQLRPARKLC